MHTGANSCYLSSGGFESNRNIWDGKHGWTWNQGFKLSFYISLSLLFSGVPTNESPESKTCSSAKVSGLQRSQEQSNSEVPFAPPVPSPTPASAPTGSPAPAAAAAPPEPPRSRLPTPPPLSVKKEQPPPPPVPTPPLLRPPPHPQSHPPHPHPHQEPRVLPPPQHHARPLISHQVHHPLQYNSLHDIRWAPTWGCLSAGAGMCKSAHICAWLKLVGY